MFALSVKVHPVAVVVDGVRELGTYGKVNSRV